MYGIFIFRIVTILSRFLVASRVVVTHPFLLQLCRIRAQTGLLICCSFFELEDCEGLEEVDSCHPTSHLLFLHFVLFEKQRLRLILIS